jgi:hypothetical protein
MLDAVVTYVCSYILGGRLVICSLLEGDRHIKNEVQRCVRGTVI